MVKLSVITIETHNLLKIVNYNGIAILIIQNVFQGEYHAVLSFISMVGCCISIVCMAMAVVIYAVYWR